MPDHRDPPAGLGWIDLLLISTAALWGMNFSVVKYALASLPPLTFNAVRFLVAALVLMTMMPLLGYRLRFERRDLPLLLGLGLLGHGFYQILFVYGAAWTTADNAALMLATVPAWVALMGTLAGTERILPRGWLGIAGALVGVAVIILASDHQATFRFGGASLRGDLMVFVATLCWSGYTLLSRRALVRYPALPVAAFTTAIGSIPLVLAGIPDFLRLDLPSVPLAVWVASALSGLLAIAVASVLWNMGVARLGSARTALYNNLVLPIAVVTAWLALGETLTTIQIAGAVLAVSGVMMARRHTSPVHR